MTDPIVPERGVPLTAETVCLLQPGDWLLHPVHGVVRYWASLADEMYVKDGPFTFLGRPDADGWIAHDGGENPAPGLEVITRTRIATAPCSAKSEWCDWAVVIAWCPHVAVAAAPALSTAETVVVPVEAAEYARLLVQELTPDQGQSASRAFGLALGLQSAIAATPGSSALCADLNSYVTRCIRSTPEASMSLEESLIARAAKALSAAPAREPEGGAVEELATQLARSIAGLGYPVGLGQAPIKEDCTKAARAIITLYGAALTPKEAPAEEPIHTGETPSGEAALYRDLENGIRPLTAPRKEAPAATGAGEDELFCSFCGDPCECGWLDAEQLLRAQPQAREEAKAVAWLVEWRFKDRPGLIPGGGSDIVRNQYAAVESLLTDLNRMPDMGWTKVTPLIPVSATPPTQPLAEGADAEKLFKVLRDESWDLRCFNVPTGGDDYDIGWRVVGHWQAEPCERTITEVFSDDPAEAVRQALAALQQEGR